MEESHIHGEDADRSGRGRGHGDAFAAGTSGRKERATRVATGVRRDGRPPRVGLGRSATIGLPRSAAVGLLPEWPAGLSTCGAGRGGCAAGHGPAASPVVRRANPT
ncbi:hypothetical protein GCM10009787_14030 [Streptomyces bangladeshensis]|uniref:Uncharacterized protein n=1 Tax=Streptomyces bangladeshensis TaxID=295352 RepID=A0ABP5N8Q4_9ACTN